MCSEIVRCSEKRVLIKIWQNKFNNQLYNKNLGLKWPSIQLNCLATFSADIESMIITKILDNLNSHSDQLNFRLAVMWAIKRIINEAKDEPHLTLISVYDRN